jgi:hypothetical protein
MILNLLVKRHTVLIRMIKHTVIGVCGCLFVTELKLSKNEFVLSQGASFVAKNVVYLTKIFMNV